MFLSWIPIVGPIIDGIRSTLTQWFDYKSVKYRVDGSVDLEAIRASVDMAEINNTNISVRIAQDIIIFPIAIWVSCITFGNIVFYIKPEWFFRVEKFPPSVEWLPYMVLAYLFGTMGLSMWKRR